MKIEKRIVDTEKGIVQITTSDERHYLVEGKYIPSVTWVLEYYYKSPFLIKWIADKGIDEAESLKKAAGNKGSRVHKAVQDLLNGFEVKISDNYDSDGDTSELSAEEWECIMSFCNWWKESKAELIETEKTVYTDKYAGTVDLICKIDGEVWLIDLKTSKSIYTSHILQVSAYKHAYEGKIDKLGIFQLGYNLNKKGYKLTEVEDKYDLFKHTYAIWEHESSQKQPLQKDFPISLKLT